MSDDFGDYELDDVYDTAPPDPEQVAIKLHRLRLAVDQLAGAHNLYRWDDLTEPEQELARAIGKSLVDWLVTHDPQPVEAARSLHNVRRFIATSPLPEWDNLSDDERSIGIDLMTLIIRWLKRQGGID